MFFAILLTLMSLPTAAALAGEPEATVDEIVVAGKRLRADHRSARVWTAADLQRESGRSVGEILRESAGVDATSGTGGNSNVLIRGATGSQVLVIIDGVKANDPSVTNRYFDWSRLDVRQVERIEILKGPQAVSYGSDAIGGVVLVTTRRGTVGTDGTVEVGSEGFVRARLSTGRELTPAGGGARQSMRFTGLAKGIFDARSSALAPVGTNPASLEGDDSREVTGGIALASEWRKQTTLDTSLDVRAAHEEIDAGGFDDDPNAIARNREIRGAVNLRHAFGESLEMRSVVSQLYFRRVYFDGLDGAHTGASDTIYRGSNTRAEVALHSDTRIEWTLGIEYLGEAIQIDSLLSPVTLARDSDRTTSLFAEYAIPVGPVSIDAGTRVSEFNSLGERQWSGKLGASSLGSQVFKLDAGVSTGFKAPSIYSLYAPIYGNADLRPEESVQLEAGVEVTPARGTFLALRGFQSRVRNRFGYDAVSYRALNVARAEVRGIEFEAEKNLHTMLRLRAHYTRLHSEDRATGKPLNDVARDKGGLKLLFDPSPRHSAIFSVIGKGPRGVALSTSRLPGFMRIDLATRHRCSNTLSVIGRFENLLNRDYQEIRGYSAPGISGYLGIEFATL